MYTRLTSVFLIAHSPKFLLEQQTYMKKKINTFHEFSFPAQGNWSVWAADCHHQSFNLGLPIFITRHKSVSSDNYIFPFREKKILKTFIVSLHSPSILIVISNLVLLFLTILIIVLKPLCDYFRIWATCICFRCLSAFSPWIVNCILDTVYEKTWRLWYVAFSHGGSPCP